MRQKLCRRLEELEKISAAAAAHRERMKPRDHGVLDELIAKAKAWHAVPENQKWRALVIADERMKPRDHGVLDELIAKAKAWHAVPENQKWLAAQPPEFFHTRVQEFRAQLRERAFGRSRSVGLGGH
jgi:hypothetical protein